MFRSRRADVTAHGSKNRKRLASWREASPLVTPPRENVRLWRRSLVCDAHVSSDRRRDSLRALLARIDRVICAIRSLPLPPSPFALHGERHDTRPELRGRDGLPRVASRQLTSVYSGGIRKGRDERMVNATARKSECRASCGNVILAISRVAWIRLPVRDFVDKTAGLFLTFEEGYGGALVMTQAAAGKT